MLVLKNIQHFFTFQTHWNNVVCSDGQPKNIDDTVHGLVLPSDCTASCWV